MKEVLQIAYLRHLQDFYLFESVKDGYLVALFSVCAFLSMTFAFQAALSAENHLSDESQLGSLTVA